MIFYRKSFVLLGTTSNYIQSKKADSWKRQGVAIFGYSVDRKVGSITTTNSAWIHFCKALLFQFRISGLSKKLNKTRMRSIRNNFSLGYPFEYYYLVNQITGNKESVIRHVFTDIFVINAAYQTVSVFKIIQTSQLIVPCLSVLFAVKIGHTLAQWFTACVSNSKSTYWNPYQNINICHARA